MSHVHLAMTALFLLLATACGDPGLEPPDSMPSCGGDEWCQQAEACYLRQPDLDVTQTRLTLDWGLQGGVHVDIPMRLTGHDPDDGMRVELWHDGERLDAGSQWVHPREGCAETLRWIPHWEAQPGIYDAGSSDYEFVFIVPTWAGTIEWRIGVRIDI